MLDYDYLGSQREGNIWGELTWGPELLYLPLAPFFLLCLNKPFPFSRVRLTRLPPWHHLTRWLPLHYGAWPP